MPGPPVFDSDRVHNPRRYLAMFDWPAEKVGKLFCFVFATDYLALCFIGRDASLHTTPPPPFSTENPPPPINNTDHILGVFDTIERIDHGLRNAILVLETECIITAALVRLE